MKRSNIFHSIRLPNNFFTWFRFEMHHRLKTTDPLEVCRCQVKLEREALMPSVWKGSTDIQIDLQHPNVDENFAQKLTLLQRGQFGVVCRNLDVFLMNKMFFFHPFFFSQHVLETDIRDKTTVCVCLCIIVRSVSWNQYIGLSSISIKAYLQKVQVQNVCKLLNFWVLVTTRVTARGEGRRFSKGWITDRWPWLCWLSC